MARVRVRVTYVFWWGPMIAEVDGMGRSFFFGGGTSSKFVWATAVESIDQLIWRACSRHLCENCWLLNEWNAWLAQIWIFLSCCCLASSPYKLSKRCSIPLFLDWQIYLSKMQGESYFSKDHPCLTSCCALNRYASASSETFEVEQE